MLVNAGGVAELTVKTKFCELEPAELWAPSVKEYEPVGRLPDRVPVPSPLSLNAAPFGSPVTDSVGSGKPLVVTLKVNGVPGGTVSVAALVNIGPELRCSVKVC